MQNNTEVVEQSETSILCWKRSCPLYPSVFCLTITLPDNPGIITPTDYQWWGFIRSFSSKMKKLILIFETIL